MIFFPIGLFGDLEWMDAHIEPFPMRAGKHYLLSENGRKKPYIPIEFFTPQRGAIAPLFGTHRQPHCGGCWVCKKGPGPLRIQGPIDAV
jgi:hypothetical protein